MKTLYFLGEYKYTSKCSHCQSEWEKRDPVTVFQIPLNDYTRPKQKNQSMH